MTPLTAQLLLLLQLLLHQHVKINGKTKGARKTRKTATRNGLRKIAKKLVDFADKHFLVFFFVKVQFMTHVRY